MLTCCKCHSDILQCIYNLQSFFTLAFWTNMSPACLPSASHIINIFLLCEIDQRMSVNEINVKLTAGLAT